MISTSLKYLNWQFIKKPKEILVGLKNFLAFGVYFFSANVLLSSLFSPWKKEVSDYGRGFDFKVYFEAFFGNVISRVIGFIMRLILLAFFLIFELITLIIGIIVFAVWLLLPFAIAAGIIYGLSNLF
jgi:hypothetical protein